ncbi:MAG: aldo/keto reductase family protein [Anaerolineaceae bacterium]|nr:aldo/keto reductase family protein [Anaerolineaceae bacterium]
MEYRRVGKSGLKVSAISLGAWLTFGSKRVEQEAAKTCIRTAIENGINFIDVADMYSYGQAEVVVGEVVKDYKRSDLVISTKAYWPMSDNVNDRGLSRKHITESVNASLKRFNLDYVDIFFCHRFDDETPVEETVRAIDDLIAQGKILYWGTSMWNATELTEGNAVAKAINANRPIVEQPEYNMLDRNFVEAGLETALEKYGMSLVVWSPLAQGILTGKYNDGIPAGSRYETVDWFKDHLTQAKIEKARGISQLAAEMGTTPAALAIAWVLKNPYLASAITGATRPEQVTENLKALDVTITDEINQKIEDILQNKPVVPKYNG